MGNKGWVLGGGAYIAAGKTQYALSLINLDVESPQAERLPLAFLGHGLAFDPRDPCRVAVFEKKGPGACLVDLRQRKLIQAIPTKSTRHFYGHGAFSADGALLYATESLLDRARHGVLVIRDGQTLRELGTLPTHGTAPHDCLILADGCTMVVANGGGALGEAEPCVTYIDLKSEALLDRVPLSSSRLNAGHIALSRRGDLAIVAAPRDGLSPQDLGAVTLRPAGGAAITVSKPAHAIRRMIGETLSVCIDEDRGLVLATHPLGDCVSMWDLGSAALVDLYQVYNPRGIAQSLDQAWYLISHTTESSVGITALSTQSRQPVGIHIEPSFTSGSHIVVRALAA